MKKLLILILALVMCLSVFTSCEDMSGVLDQIKDGAAGVVDQIKDKVDDIINPGEEQPPVDEDLEAAISQLNFLYYEEDTAENPGTFPTRNFEVLAQITGGSTEYTLTWSENSDLVEIKAGAEGFYKVVLPYLNETEVAYVLTVVLTDANGATKATLTFDYKLPVYDNTKSVTDPEEGVAYKIFMNQVTLGQTLYALGGELDSQGKYYRTTTDAKKANDFYVEAVNGGFKFYYVENGTNHYVEAYLGGDNGLSKRLRYTDAENATIWKYDVTTNSWQTTINGSGYVLGTYSTYDTFSISEASKISASNTGVTQFPAELVAKEVAESAAPAPEVVIYNTPAEIMNAAYALDANQTLSAGHKYTLTGVIVSVDTAFSADFGNVTVTMTVNGTDGKTIQCFRLSGTGADVIKVGDTITVTGVIIHYVNETGTQDKIEFNTGCTLDSYVPGGETTEHEHAECPTCGLCTAEDCTGTDAEKCQGGHDAPSVTTSTIAEILAGAAGEYHAEGTVIAVNAKSFLLQDTTGTMLVYLNTTPSVNVGDVVTVSGTTSVYGGAKQFGQGSTVTKTGTATVSHGTAKELTAAECDAYLTASVVTPIYVKLTGVLNVSGNYMNLPIEGATIIGSLTYLAGDLKTSATALNGKEIVVEGYVTGVTGSSSKYLNLMVVSVEEVVEVTPPHECESVCPDCGKCLDAECTETACAEKCPTHPAAPTHTHTACGECGLCTAEDCTGTDAEKCAAYTTAEEIMNAAYALAQGATLSNGHKYTLTGVVQFVDEAYNSQFSNVTLTILVEGTNKTLKCYRLKGTGADVIGAGDTITVTGVIKNYYGTIEFDAGCTLDSYTVHECVWSEATCEDPATCSICRKTDGEALGHNYVNGVCSVCEKEEPAGGQPTWQLVTDVSTLKAGDKIVIVATNVDYALSTKQNSNNRGVASVTKSGNTVTFGDDVQILTLKAGATAGTWALDTGSGYLYAASTSSNHLKTGSTLNNKASFTITVSSNGVATIKADQDARNWLRFNPNNGSPIFSCYTSGQQDVSIYVLR